MGLAFEICGACAERHAVQRNGRMSIHTTALGGRCEGPTFPEPVIHQRPAAPRPVRKKPARPEEKQWERCDDPELEAAFDFVHEEKVRRRHAGPLDRRIYATDDVHTVRGGLPTLSRRSR